MSRVLHSLRWCDDCSSEHLGAPCGMTYAQRLKSVRLSQAATPTKAFRNNYDSEALNGMFGGSTEAERHEQMMEETQGVGAANQQELRGPHADALAEHYLQTHPDWEGFESPEVVGTDAG